MAQRSGLLPDGTRARKRGITINDIDWALLERCAQELGITRSALIRRWLHEHAGEAQ
jgi:hypothetical protein